MANTIHIHQMEELNSNNIDGNELLVISNPNGQMNGYDTNKLSINQLKGFINEGEVQIRNEDKTITQNGTYSPTSGYTGFGQVTVNVPMGGVIIGDDDTGQNVMVKDGYLYLGYTKVNTTNNIQIGLYGLHMSSGANSTRYVVQKQNVSYCLKGSKSSEYVYGFNPLYFHIAIDDYPFVSDYHWKVGDLIITHYEDQPRKPWEGGWVAFAPESSPGLSITINYGIKDYNKPTATVVDGHWTWQ